MPFAKELDSNAAALSLRGKVSENGNPRFFRRFAEGVFDLEDLIERAHELADFLQVAETAYHFTAAKLYAFGYSNGANMAAALLLLRSKSLAGAILMRATLPFEPQTITPLLLQRCGWDNGVGSDMPIFPNLNGTDVLILNGTKDPYAPVDKVERLARILNDGGARVELRLSNLGHSITRAEIHAARDWLRGL